MIILETRRYTITDEENRYDLTRNQMEILKVLKDNMTHNDKQLMKVTGMTNYCALKNAVNRLKKEIPIIQIDRIYGVGYILKSVMEVR